MQCYLIDLVKANPHIMGYLHLLVSLKQNWNSNSNIVAKIVEDWCFPKLRDKG